MLENNTEDFQKIDITLVVPNPIALRTVRVESESFLELVEDVKHRGIQHPPSARVVDVEGVKQYQLVDGLHRYTAALHAGQKTIILKVSEMSDEEVAYQQIAMNSHTTDTRPAEFTKMLQHLINLKPLNTLAEIAKSIGKNPEFVKTRLQLLKIENPQIVALVDDGAISLSNAYGLARLPVEEQLDFMTAAQSETAKDFAAMVTERCRVIADAKRGSRKPQDKGFIPTPKMRKFAILKDAADDTTLVANLASQVTTVEDAVELTLKYVVQLDPQSVATAKKAYDANQAAEVKAREDAKQKRLDAAAAKTALAHAAADRLL